VTCSHIKFDINDNRLITNSERFDPSEDPLQRSDENYVHSKNFFDDRLILSSRLVQCCSHSVKLIDKDIDPIILLDKIIV